MDKNQNIKNSENSPENKAQNRLLPQEFYSFESTVGSINSCFLGKIWLFKFGSYLKREMRKADGDKKFLSSRSAVKIMSDFSVRAVLDMLAAAKVSLSDEVIAKFEEKLKKIKIKKSKKM